MAIGFVQEANGAERPYEIASLSLHCCRLRFVVEDGSYLPATVHTSDCEAVRTPLQVRSRGAGERQEACLPL